MTLFRFIVCVFVFIGTMAAAGAFILAFALLLRFPLVLLAVLLACGLFIGVLRKAGTGKSARAPHDNGW
ncbi:hypothetical protein D3C84_1046550 [compost metagenome]